MILKSCRNRHDLKFSPAKIQKISHLAQYLSAFYYLCTNNLQNETKNQYVQNMLFCLQGYGYELVEYSLPTSGFFAKKMNPNVSEETMYLPAIVKDVNSTKIVVAQGVVYIPQK